MNHAQDLDLSFEIEVRDDVGEPRNHKLASSFDSAWPAKARMRFELCDLALDLCDHPAGSGWIVGRDVVVDLSEVEQGAPGVPGLHAPGLPCLAKNALTSSSVANSPRLACARPSPILAMFRCSCSR